jgi:hypothetical protein
MLGKEKKSTKQVNTYLVCELGKTLLKTNGRN